MEETKRIKEANYRISHFVGLSGVGGVQKNFSEYIKMEISNGNEYKHKIEQLVNAQKKFITTVISDAKKFLKEGDTEKGGVNLLRAYRGLPRNKALIKFLSEEGVRTKLQKN